MFTARKSLDRWQTLRFYKLVGLGGGHGYSLKTSFDSYGIFTVWDHPQDADYSLGRVHDEWVVIAHGQGALYRLRETLQREPNTPLCYETASIALAPGVY